jgi:uncharacterized FlaG/YvyC family protein
MVQIYLDGLTPRVQKMWDKLGKKPEAIQIKLLDSTEIDSAVKKAKEERAKLKKEEQVPLSQQQAPQEEKKLTPEEIKQKEDQINELTGQINTALERSDKNMANELFSELPPIIVKFPDDKKKEWQKKFDELKQKIA